MDLAQATTLVREYFRDQCVEGLVEFEILLALETPQGGYAIRCRAQCFLAAKRVYEVWVSEGKIKAVKEIPPPVYRLGGQNE